MSLLECQLAINGHERKRVEDFEMLAQLLGVEIQRKKPDMTRDEVEALNTRALETIMKHRQEV